MKITKINDQEYSRDLVRRIGREKQDAFLEKMGYASVVNPYAFTSTGDSVTLLFEEGDQRGVILPLQTNVTRVENVTDYASKPRFNWLKNILVGKLEGVQVQKLEEFLAELAKRDIGDLSLVQESSIAQNGDYRNKGRKEPTFLGRNSERHIPQESTIEDRLSDVRDRFVRFPDRFLIDPRSHLRVERRITRHGAEIYEASLKIHVYTGLSGVPGINDYIGQVIRAKTKGRN